MTESLNYMELNNMATLSLRYSIEIRKGVCSWD
jgi:hypothetical protein